MGCEQAKEQARKILEEIQDGVSKSEHYEMLAYQKANDNMMIKGKLFLKGVNKLREVVKENYKVEVYSGIDLNGQRLLIIREVTNSVIRKDKKTIPIENCDLYVTKLSPNAESVMVDILKKNE
jgi:methionine salvage enolase-phosphatase E1